MDRVRTVVVIWCLGFLVVLLAYGATLPERPYDLRPHATFAVGEYLGPEGCAEAVLAPGTSLPKTCTQDRITEPERYGLRGDRGWHWIRIDDRAALVGCPAFEQTCDVRLVVEHRFRAEACLPADQAYAGFGRSVTGYEKLNACGLHHGPVTCEDTARPGPDLDECRGLSGTV